MAITPQISVAPVPYFWSRNDYLDYYARIAELPVDVVYVGETVCSKRKALSISDWLDIAAVLRDLGKQVVMSTLTLIESESEISYLRSLLKASDYWIEANDMAAVEIAHSLRRPFVAGTALNAYNLNTLKCLRRSGMQRWQPPVEISRDALKALLLGLSKESELNGLETELLVFGRITLAHSARCFTARSENRPKDQCEFRCGAYAEGMPLYSQDNQPLFRINGIQVQSEASCNLLGYYNEMLSLGITHYRVAEGDMAIERPISILSTYRQGVPVPVEIEASTTCNGYWWGKPGFNLVLPNE